MPRHGDSGATRFDRLFEGALILVGVADLHGVKLQPKLPGGELAFCPLRVVAPGLWVPQDRDAREFGYGFLEYLQSFAC